MSIEYDNYLNQHRANVYKGFVWIKDNLPEILNFKNNLDWQTEYNHDKSKMILKNTMHMINIFMVTTDLIMLFRILITLGLDIFTTILIIGSIGYLLTMILTKEKSLWICLRNISLR